MKVIWSMEALESYYKIIDYLLDNWSGDVLENFINSVDDLIDKVSSYTEICPLSKVFNLRKCGIDKHNSLVYTIVNNNLYLITFVDNRSDHIF